jgi:hypothetical protein
MKKYLEAVPTLLLLTILAMMLWANPIDWDHPESAEPPADFPILEQPDQITCGPTSAAMLLAHHGKEVSVDEVALRSRTRWFVWYGENIVMTTPENVSLSLNHFGVPSKVTRCPESHLKYYISEGRFPIVLVRSSQTTWHYVVAIGYDRERYVVADPGCGSRREIPSEHFLKAWAFTHDIWGNPCGMVCPLCKGSWLCLNCAGGRIDPLRDLLAAGEVRENTVILPDRKKE